MTDDRYISATEMHRVQEILFRMMFMLSHDNGDVTIYVPSDLSDEKEKHVRKLLREGHIFEAQSFAWNQKLNKR